MLTRECSISYSEAMSGKMRNKDHGEYEDGWKDIPVCAVAVIGRAVVNVFPFDGEFTSRDVGVRMAHEGSLNGSLFDLYIYGYFYPMDISQTAHKRIWQAPADEQNMVLAEELGKRVQEIRELHHAFYFRDEIPVDNEGSEC